ncbi:MAG: molybdopterin-dependent oxidoreductase, partial [Deferribacterales bacterium]|nr:molybdopterin-dependent oxidoreductase [Deferribacterales bacterium]
LVYKDDLVFDKEVKQYFSTGPHNCGMRCVHKLFVKNGRVINMTSDGDIPREGSTEIDESVEDVQKRACVRGYSYLKRQYQPDRFKYPLLQTKERGDLTGFKRIPWSEAIERLGGMMKEMINRKSTLGYLPIRCFWNVPSLLKVPDANNPDGLGPCFAVYGNASFGNIASALWDAVGYDSAYNHSVDMLNSKFILSWAVDPSTSFGHQGASYWFYTKAKEAGVPIVFIEAKYSDAVAVMGTGTTLTYNKNGRNFNNYEIPAVVVVRPGTDCAMAAAMCYVIWKNKEYDEQFLREKCFGFFAGDTCTNESTDPTQFVAEQGTANFAYADLLKMSNANYYDPRNHIAAAKEVLATGSSQYLQDFLGNQNYLFASPWRGKTFTVPQGESFVEYMQQLETRYGGGTYQGVLDWAANVTGAAPDLIEALALKYATTKPARLDGGGGPQRTFDGMYYSWFTIALAAMTGNSDKKGGGPGYSMMNEAGAYTFHASYFSGGGNRLDPFKHVLISIDNWADVILTGRDERTPEQVMEDMLIFHNINLKDKADAGEKLLEIDMMISCANHLVSMPNVNKNIYAVTKRKDNNPNEYELKYNVTVDHFMTPTAAFSDLVLPCTTHWEEADGVGIYTMPDVFMKQQAVEPMFEAKSDAQIWYEVGKLLPLASPEANTPPVSGVGNPIADATAKYMYESVFSLNTKVRDAVNPSWQPPTYEEFKARGRANLPVPKENAIVGLQTISPIGSLATTTGRINFYSPFYGEIRPGRTLASGPRYIDKSLLPNFGYYDGYEKMLDANGNLVGWTSPQSGRTYKLQVLTDKGKHRAHTAFDNVAIIKDKFPQTCKINPIDAAERGISDGEMVYVYCDRGCIKVPAEVTNAALPGVIRIQHGAWYRAHPTEKVKVWLRLDKSSDQYTQLEMPVDVGGSENMLTLDKQTGANDPFIGGSIYVQGNLCEVSKVKPE